jgi:hypothetical protein
MACRAIAETKTRMRTTWPLLAAVLVIGQFSVVGCSSRDAAQSKPRTGDSSAANLALKAVTVVASTPHPTDPPAVQWTREFLGDSAAFGDYVEQTSDGGYVVAGQTGIGLGIRLWLVKTNSNGDMVWTKTLGESTHQPTEAFAALQTADGGYIVGANGVLTNREDRDVWLVKLTRQGDLVWQNEVSSDIFQYGNATGRAVVQTRDGGYAVSAFTTLSDSAVLLFKTDSLGNRQWLKRYPILIEFGTYDMFPLCRTSDGGYIIGTRTLLKVDSMGNLQWLRTFDDIGSANSVVQTADGGYVVTGPASDLSSTYVLKVHADGSPEWIVPRLAYDVKCEGFRIEQTADGGFAIAGSYRGQGDRSVACVFRLEAGGVHAWTDSLFPGVAACVRQARDGGDIITGTSYVPTPTPYGRHRMFLTKLAPERKR